MSDDSIVFLIPLTAITAPVVILVAHFFFNAVSKTICHWRDVSLKIRLAEQRHSPDEIERIVLAGRDTPPKPSKKNAYNARPNWQTQASSLGKPPIKPAPLKSV